MSVIAWGKPKVEIAAYVDGELPVSPNWQAMPTIKENTANLFVSKGAKKEARGAGGEIVDVRYQPNTYGFECTIYVKKGDTAVLSDNDGVVAGNYAVRVTPEDDTIEGFMLPKTIVTVEQTWTEEDGKLLKYTFDGLKPESGNTCVPYTYEAPAG